MSRIRESSLGGALLFLFFVGGCSDSFPGIFFAPDVVVPAAIETDLRDPAAVLAAYEEATNRRDFAAIERLLDADFECISAPADFPWSSLEPWGREVELAITANFFDPSFQCPCGIPAIESVTIDLVLVSMEPSSNDGTRLLSNLTGQVQLLPLDPFASGWSFDARLAFGLVQRGDFWRIRSIEEIVPVGRPGLRPSAADAFVGELPDLRDDLPPLPRAARWCVVRALYAPLRGRRFLGLVAILRTGSCAPRPTGRFAPFSRQHR